MHPGLWKALVAGMIVLAAAGIVFGLVRVSRGPDARYQKAVSLIGRDSCRDAASVLEELGDYRDAKALLSYCRAYLAFEKYDRSTFAETHKYLDQIPAGYSGDCEWEVAYLRSGLALAETPRRPVTHSTSEYADRLPFKGMPASSVGRTILGVYSDKESAGSGLTRYEWISGSGDLYFYAIGDASAITEVSKCNDSLYWDGDTFCPDGVQSRPAAAQPAAASGSGDPFDAADYSEPDDFYYDHPDDFYDNEDAEDYWNAHR